MPLQTPIHGYGAAGLSDEQICNLVDFLQGYVIDTDLYVAGGSFLGDVAAGRLNYTVAGGYYTCLSCHANMPSPGFFEGYLRTGHPYKLVHTGGAEPAAGTWPYTPPPPLPVAQGAQLQWSDVEYVIGNYFCKARFIDRNGYIYTGLPGEKTPWNLQTQLWAAYNAGQVKPHDCGRCHTTGYQATGNQLGLPGLIGTWVQDGVRCEACHGPAGDHVNDPSMIAPPGGLDCSGCHYRDPQYRMPWSGGFMQHHQQAEDFSHSPHATWLTCNSCHNPHRSTVYEDGGLIAQCADCHAGSADNGFYQVAGMEGVDCIECHMPHMGKSAVAVNAYKADIRGHLFRIMTEPVPAAQNVYQAGGGTFWDQEGGARITLDYACLGCHTEIGQPLTIQQASEFAFHLHTAHPAVQLLPCPADLDGAVGVVDFLALLNAWEPC